MKNSTKPKTMGDLITMKKTAKFWRNRKYKLLKIDQTVVIQHATGTTISISIGQTPAVGRPVFTLRESYSDADYQAFLLWWDKKTKKPT